MLSTTSSHVVPYRQCTRCVMDTTDEFITFDQKGHCNHCTAYFINAQRVAYQGAASDEKRDALIDRIKQAGVGKPYDSIIGVSGGVDSCYVAYQAKVFGLRPLLVHMDNGWNSGLAVRNIKLVVDKLGFDYESYVLDWTDFRAIQVAFLRASVVDAEVPTDIAIPAALHEIAARHGITYVLNGGNVATEGILPKSWGYNAKDTAFYHAVRNQYCDRDVSSLPTFGLTREFYFKFFKKIRTIYLLNYSSFSKAEAVGTLKRELGWTDHGGKHHESRYTAFLQSYILPVKFNIDYRRATLSTQICAGDVSREAALRKLQSLPYDVEKLPEEKRYVCKKLGLSPSDFEAIMQLPTKSYRDYPNHDRMLEVAYGIYRALDRIRLV